MGLEHAGVDLLQGDVAAEGEAAPAQRRPIRARRSTRPCAGPSPRRWRAAPRRRRGAARSRRRAAAGAGRRGRRRGRRPRPRARGRRTARPRRRRAAAAPISAPPGRRRDQSRRASAAPPGGRRSARARRRRRSSRPGRRTRRNSAKARSRSGMWWRTAWPKTRSKLSSSKGSASASVATVVTPSRPSASAVAASRFSIPGEMSVAVSRSITPSWTQVEREVAGAGADLQRVAEASGPSSPPSALTSFSRTCSWPIVAEVDAPLGVVFVGGRVVVAGVDVLDVLRAWRWGRLASARNSTHYGPRAVERRVPAARTSPPGCRRCR